MKTPFVARSFSGILLKICTLLLATVFLANCSWIGLGSSEEEDAEAEKNSEASATGQADTSPSGTSFTPSRIQTTSGAKVDGIAAVVNGEIITIGQLNSRVNTIMGTRQAKGVPRGVVQKKMMEVLIDQELMSQAAEKKGVFITEKDITQAVNSIIADNKLTQAQFENSLARSGSTVAAFRDELRIELLRNRVMGAQVLSRVVITDTEVLKFLNGEGPEIGKGQLGGEPDKRPLRMIILPLDPKNKAAHVAEAKRIKKEIDDGTLTFAEAAKKYSKGPGRDKGGDAEDGATVANLPPQLQAALASVEPGQPTEPLEAGNAVVLLTVGASAEPVVAKPPPVKKGSLAEFSQEEKENARRQLEVYEMQQNYITWVTELKQSAIIRINI